MRRRLFWGAELVFALTFALEKGWLTVGLALMVPGIAYISTQRPLPLLRATLAREPRENRSKMSGRCSGGTGSHGSTAEKPPCGEPASRTGSG